MGEIGAYTFTGSAHQPELSNTNIIQINATLSNRTQKFTPMNYTNYLTAQLITINKLRFGRNWTLSS